MEKKPKKSFKPILKKIIFCILVLVWAFIASYASQYIVGLPMLWILGKETLSTPIWTMIDNLLCYVLSIVLTIFVPYLFSKKLKSSREELGLKELPTWTDIGLAPVGYAAVTLVVSLIFNILQSFTWFDANEIQKTGFNTLSTGPDKIIAFFAIVIIAPIAEEIIYRGWIYGKLRTRLKAPISIIVTSLLFAVMHGQINVAISVFVLSVVSCCFREITGTIYAGILMHMLQNGIAFYMLFVFRLG